MASDESNHHTYKLRTATHEDLRFLPAIEISAAELFRSDPSLAPIADDEPMSEIQHEECVEAWRNTGLNLKGSSGIWVATVETEGRGSSDAIVAFVVTQPLRLREQAVDCSQKRYFVHIKELSVHADHQRRGLASKLIQAVKEFAADYGTDNGISGLSLTTFRDVPFNGLFYARYGFRELSVASVSLVVDDEGLMIWNDEQKHFASVGDGSLKDRRCWMVATL